MNSQDNKEKKSFKEKRIRKITKLYYSKPEIQKAIFNFAKNREISPRYFNGFGKRPDTFQYLGDVFQIVKKGATSFHCSEELWENPLDLETGISKEKLNELRIGWDLLIDIDCKYFDFSKKAAKAILQVFNNHGIENIGIKFSGNKGFHIILPWKAFPKEIAGNKTKNLFPELPKKLLSYIGFKANEEIQKLLSEEEIDNLTKNTKIKRGIKCNNCRELADTYEKLIAVCPKCKRQEIRKISNEKQKENYKCPDCNVEFEIMNSEEIYECKKCNLSSEKNPDSFSRHIEVDFFDLMGLDLVLVSSRHLFRMPYSLHEKTSLSSVVLEPEQIDDFDLKDANALKVKVKEFIPESTKEEANELIREALDWAKNNEIKSGKSRKKTKGKYKDFKPLSLKNIENSQFPPCIHNILKGMRDGKKRALFILMNLFRSLGMDSEEMEKRIYAWNKKNNPPLKEGYIKSQFLANYKRKPLMPPNCKEYYQGIGVCTPDSLCSKVKNPMNYVVRKNYSKNKNNSKKKDHNNKFKKNN